MEITEVYMVAWLEKFKEGPIQLLVFKPHFGRYHLPEMLPDLVLKKMKVPQKADDVPEISPEQLLEADGFIFGFSSRFGVMAAQFKAFFDATADIWATQAL